MFIDMKKPPNHFIPVVFIIIAHRIVAALCIRSCTYVQVIYSQVEISSPFCVIYFTPA